MHLLHLKAQNIRIIEDVSLVLDPSMNLIVGPNGSGKTSLLEAVHLLGTGRSFRARSIRDVLRRGSTKVFAFGEVASSGNPTRSIGIEKGAVESRIRVAGEEAKSASTLARLLPLVVVTPDCQRLLTDGADLRRQLLDWLMFHVEPSYLEVHQRYRRTLRQRNACLRQGASVNSVTPWNEALGVTGDVLHQLRTRRLHNVLPRWGVLVERILEMPVDIEYVAGWDASLRLAEALEGSTQQDLVRGFTQVGAHRADLSFRVQARPVQHVLSRGESKLFTVSVLLGQATYFGEESGQLPVILVDDLSSELDSDSRQRFFAGLEQSRAQVLVTTVDEQLVMPHVTGRHQLFHVEQGKLEQVV